ncbi:MAG: 5,6-dimethylbenzimidazole synthase [Novosphingobium sp.]
MSEAPTFDAAFLDQLGQLFAWRRDVRHFQSRAVGEGLIEELLNTACLAPSVGNSQPWRFGRIGSVPLRAAILAHVKQEVRAAGAIYPDAARRDYDSLKLHGLAQAPEWIAVYCDEAASAGRGLGRQTMPETLHYSAVMAIHTLWLAARARGLGLGWVSILNPLVIDGLLEVPNQWRFIALLCLGWPERDDDRPELDRTGWQERLPPASMRFTR